MSWSPQQDAAVKSVAAWLRDRNGPQVFRLFGYAGTGKTTLAIELAGLVRGLVLYATYTGKAALVLRSKGCAGATTIHSLIYKAQTDEATGAVEFKINRKSDLKGAGLLIVDEVSMVSEDLATDLLSFGTKILVLGDPAQLPPVKGEGFFISKEPDVMLTEVHRQAQDNPIIRMSMDVREGRGLSIGTYGNSRVLDKRTIDRGDLGQIVLGADQVICGLNKSRQKFNGRIRELKGLAGKKELWHPSKGDRLICLKNNRKKHLLNGSLWTLDAVLQRAGKFVLDIEPNDEDRELETVGVMNEFFNGTEASIDWKKRKNSFEFTFGWAMTCHKSQGSQWQNVMIFDESRSFREYQRHWLYTSLTRAADRVTVAV